jgi:hypothetical protein
MNPRDVGGVFPEWDGARSIALGNKSAMEESLLIYCDESGNDGPNYLNEQAPFYVLAGWVVPENAIVDAAVEMESLRTVQSIALVLRLVAAGARAKSWRIAVWQMLNIAKQSHGRTSSQFL